MHPPNAHRPLRAKLIFNANSGRTEESPHQLASILSEMQKRDILPEVHMVGPDSRIEAVVRQAIKSGIRLIVIAGGDGTIDIAAGALVNSPATLGLIPTGTRNNLALNLGIPSGIPEAVELLRTGRTRKIDVGHIRRGRASRWFIEAATLGLLSDLFPVADDIQHGNLAQIGELLSTFFTAAPSHLRGLLDGRKHIDTTAHMLLIANMSFLGPNFQVATDVSYRDSHLDVFVFSEMSKLNLIAYVMQALSGPVENPGFKHYRVKRLSISASPHMPVLADGVLLGQGSVAVSVRPRALRVITGQPTAAPPAGPGSQNHA